MCLSSDASIKNSDRGHFQKTKDILGRAGPTGGARPCFSGLRSPGMGLPCTHPACSPVLVSSPCRLCMQPSPAHSSGTLHAVSILFLNVQLYQSEGQEPNAAGPAAWECEPQFPRRRRRASVNSQRPGHSSQGVAGLLCPPCLPVPGSCDCVLTGFGCRASPEDVACGHRVSRHGRKMLCSAPGRRGAGGAGRHWSQCSLQHS